jgi:ATP-dependent RNA helicase RhlE
VPREDHREAIAPREKEADPLAMPAVPSDNEFRALGLSDSVVAAVLAKGYLSPTAIQRQAIPIVIEGRDLLGTAQTGTGKTAAFALPVLHRLAQHGACRCLVLEPTRELALQVEESFRTYGKHTDLRVCVIYGGVGYGRQREQLAMGVDIIVATPGRLLDLMSEGDVKLGQLEVLILDEVDRMLDMGFLPDVRRIIQKCPKQRQTLFFSATLPPQIQGLVRSVLNDPVAIEIGIRSSPAETVDHAFYPVVA